MHTASKINIFAMFLNITITGVADVILTHVMLNKLRCHTHFYFFSQLDTLIQVADINSHSEWQKANLSGSVLFAKVGHIGIQQDQGYFIFSEFSSTGVVRHMYWSTLNLWVVTPLDPEIHVRPENLIRFSGERMCTILVNGLED